MSPHFIDLAYDLAQVGLVPGRDFSYDPANRQLLLSHKAKAFIESVVPGAKERFGWK